MHTPEPVTYEGPAILIPRDEDREYSVNARIREGRVTEFDPVGTMIYDVRSWEADLDGDHLSLPDRRPRECVLRLPDGRQGLALFGYLRIGGSKDRPTTWAALLIGQGPSPIRAPYPAAAAPAVDQAAALATLRATWEARQRRHEIRRETSDGPSGRISSVLADAYTRVLTEFDQALETTR